MSDLAAAAATVAPADAVRRTTARPAQAAADSLIMAARCLRLASRNLDALLISVMLPVMMMLLFVYLFGGAIEIGTRYVTYVVPGVLLICAGYGASLTAVTVSHDMTGGIIDRFRSLDVGGPAVLGGHVAASVARNTVSTLLVVGVAFLIGFRPSADALGWLGAAGVLLLFVLAMSWLSAAIGMLAKSPEAASGFTFFVLFLPYPSSAFVPIETMPTWIHGFAQHQPATPVIESIRGLLLGGPLGTSPWQAMAWCGGILVASVVASGILFRRRTG